VSTEADIKIFALSDITRRIAEVLEPARSKRFWVRAELGEISEKNGHLYGTLLEMEQGKQVARMSFSLWRNDRARIAAAFERAGLAFELKAGMKIVLYCQLNFHPVFGLSLQAVDADPRFVLGELELRRREIIERLRARGDHERNKALLVPRLPLRIGLITSRESAAYFDVIQTLRNGGFAFRVSLTDATMQGEKAEQSILDALAALAPLDLDLVMLIRGGGSKTDLATLDSERIAQAIAAYRKPVWVAIGHETDSGVLDVVAHSAFKTPTALAEHIVQRFLNAERDAVIAQERLQRAWAHVLGMHQLRMREDSIGIQQGSRKMAELARSELRTCMERLRRSVAERTHAELRALDTDARDMHAGLREALRRRETTILDARRRMYLLASGALSLQAQALGQQRTRLSPVRIASAIESARRALGQAEHRADAARTRAVRQRRTRLAALAATLHASALLERLRGQRNVLEQQGNVLRAHDPQRVLERGYAIVRDERDSAIRGVGALVAGQSVRMEMHDGTASATINNKEERDERTRTEL